MSWCMCPISHANIWSRQGYVPRFTEIGARAVPAIYGDRGQGSPQPIGYLSRPRRGYHNILCTTHTTCQHSSGLKPFTVYNVTLLVLPPAPLECSFNVEKPLSHNPIHFHAGKLHICFFLVLWQVTHLLLPGTLESYTSASSWYSGETIAG